MVLNDGGSKVREWCGGGLQGSTAWWWSAELAAKTKVIWNSEAREGRRKKRVSQVSETHILDRF